MLDLNVLLKEAWEARTKWYNLGLELGLLQHALDAIKHNCRDVMCDCFREMLSQILSSTTLSWSHIILALRKPHIGLASLANELAKSHDSKLMESPPTMPPMPLNDSEADQNQSLVINCNGKGKKINMGYVYRCIMCTHYYRCFRR